MDRLKDLFYSKEFNMGSLKNFRKFLKQKNIDIPYKSVKEFYEKQDVIQRSKPIKSRSKFLGQSLSVSATNEPEK